MIILLSGPPHMSLVIVPRTGVNLTSWNLQSPVLEADRFDGRPLYFIFYSRATYTDNIQPKSIQLGFKVRFITKFKIHNFNTSHIIILCVGLSAN